MTDDDFRALVRRMRAAQNWYFRGRTHAALDTAKALEAEVDRRLAEQDGGLFDAPASAAEPPRA